MVNTVILILIAAALISSVVTAVAEPFLKRNSASGRFFRAIRIRLREISLTGFCVTAILLILWGLIVHDTFFEGIWAAILMLFVILLILHPEDIFDFTKRRKKARLKNPLPLAKSAKLCETETKLAGILPELTPMKIPESDDNADDNTT